MAHKLIADTLLLCRNTKWITVQQQYQKSVKKLQMKMFQEIETSQSNF